MEAKENRPTTAAPANGAPRNSMSGRSPQNALRNNLRGADFAQGEAMLAPVQHRAPNESGPGRLRKDKTREPEPRDGGELEPMDLSMETFRLGGRTVEEHFITIQEHLEFANLRLLEYHSKGFQSFVNTMQFDSSIPTESESSALGKVLEQVAIKVLDSVLGVLPGGPALQILRETFSLATATPAPTSGALGAYTMHESQRIGEYYNAVSQTLAAHFVPDMFTRFAGIEGEAPAPDDMALTGEHAVFMRSALQQARKMRSVSLNTGRYQDECMLAWLRNSKEGGRGTTSRGLKNLANGTIRVEVEADEDDGSWTFELEDALLYASARTGQAADLVRDAIGSGRETLWGLGLPVFVVFEGPGVAGGTTKYDVQVSAPGRVVGNLNLAPAAMPLWRALVADATVWQQVEAKVTTALKGA